MKKGLMIGAALLAIVGVAAASNTKKTTSDTSASEDIFVKYNNELVTDAKGYYMLFQDGKLYSAAESDLLAWVAKNPGKPFIQSPLDIWEYYTSNHPELIGRF